MVMAIYETLGGYTTLKKKNGHNVHNGVQTTAAPYFNCYKTHIATAYQLY